MAELIEYTLGELTINFDSARRPIKSSDRTSGETPYYGASGIVDWVVGHTHDGDFLLISEDGENLRSRSAPIAFETHGKVWVNNHAHVVAGRNPADTRLLRYALAQTDIAGYLTGSAQPKLSKSAMESIRLRLPTCDSRHAIAEVLGALDDKIAANDRTVRVLGNLSAALLEAELSKGQRSVPLGELATFHNRRRVPLSGRERESRNGTVPYYGAAGQLDTVDEALFNEPLSLVGEDGTVMRDGGQPVVQYIWGPSWVNNHAHVLTGNGISTELLSILLRRLNVAHLVTGAVQPKLSMGNLKSLEVAVPRDPTAIERRAQAHLAMHRATTDENTILARTRDELLPLLMSGKVRVGSKQVDARDFIATDGDQPVATE
ncbi:hypothetical protein FOE78_02155 [Microlunatus elymi]|uniref:Type I restriction modification DNA specificity domain-containing protein n=1 Tax=Microlunatus elymi TaxID=2596828 RepID=A0A516PUP5_9ACTN|nr:restriction endonuclease subunit S [Microlunatus elymi]QDP94879.1 hypothetical protein FOE78_02155 [Microlunatus elymi]